MISLDDPRHYARLDAAGMRDRIAGLPDQAREAWAAAQAWELPPSFRTPRRVVVLGVGGSAIGADLVAALAAAASPVPVQVLRGHAPPATEDGTLVVACSFSGETEETLSAFEGTLGGEGMRLAISTGGRLSALAEKRGFPLFRYHWDGPPRSALAYGLLPLLAILQRLDALPAEEGAAERALDGLSSGSTKWGTGAPESSNVAKQVAQRLAGRLPVILGAGILAVAAQRWAQQTSENAKQWAFHAGLPEANHNLVVGLGAPPAAVELMHVVLLDSPATDERSRLRLSLTAGLLDDAGVAHEQLNCGGESALGTALRACHLGDWVSLYLAVLNGVDPTPVPAIDALKAALAERP